MLIELSGAPGNRTHRSSACNTDVFPLDERPICFVLEEKAAPLLVRRFPTFQYPEQESNLQTLGFKPSRSADWRTWAS